MTRTPILQGNPSSGIFSLAADKSGHLIALGGDYKEPDNFEHAAANSPDGGKTWQLAARQPGGFRSALARVDDGRWVAVGPTGEDITTDNGVHWKHTDSWSLNAVAILDIWSGWAVGDHGRIARFVVRHNH